jgi:ribosomal protein S21
MRTKDTYHVEVTVEETEPADSAMRRFRRAVMAANLLNEARRRRNFEDTQDIKKRKIRERGQRKKRQFRVTTFDEQAGLDPAPFADLFGESDDLFDGDLPDFQPANGRQRVRSYNGGQQQGGQQQNGKPS